MGFGYDPVTSVSLVVDLDSMTPDEVIVGNPTGITTGVSHALQVLGTGGPDSGMTLARFSADANGPHIDMVKSRNGAIGGLTIVQDNDVLGRVNFVGDDGTDYSNLAAVFQAEVDDATPAANDIGVAFVWRAQPGGGGAIADVLRLSAAGALTPGVTNAGSLGTVSLMWSDLFLASGAVVNFDNGNATVTHGAATLTVDGAAMVFNEAGADLDFRVEGSGLANALFVQGSEGFVGFGTNAPGCPVAIASTAAVINSGGYFLHLGSIAAAVDTVRNMIGFSHGNDFTDGNVRAGIGCIVVSGGAGELVFETGSTGTQAERVRINSASIVATCNIVPEADGTRSLGTQTTAQWANVWSDLINGSDYAYLNSWRTLEAEKYDGYPEGLAFGNTHFESGKVTDAMPPDAKPVFVVTDGWLEFQGRRITPAQLDALLALACD